MYPANLCVNVDHVATIRNARGTPYPDPVHLAVLALNAGADGIVCHLREDRRHILERDVGALRITVPNLGLEIGLDDEIVRFALEMEPDLAMIVPERREELTTESGLDVVGNAERVAKAVAAFREKGIRVSLFVDPVEEQIDAAARAGAGVVELHTGPYADAADRDEWEKELERLADAAAHAAERGLRVHAGHGLRTDNVGPVVDIDEVEEVSIGHSIVARALSVGMEAAVKEMREAMYG